MIFGSHMFVEEINNILLACDLAIFLIRCFIIEISFKSLSLFINLKIELKKEELNSTRQVLAGEFINKYLLVELTGTGKRIIIKSYIMNQISK